MEDDGEDLTPFWLRSTTETRHNGSLRRCVSSLFFSSGVVVVLLLVTALFFLFFIVPSSTQSFSAQIFRTNSVKKSWDSLNIVLVLLAVVFGFLSRIKNQDRNSYYDDLLSSPNKQNESQKSKPTSSGQWYSYNYDTVEGTKANTTSVSNLYRLYQHSDYQMKLENKVSFLRRNNSSYPDLREFSSNRCDNPRGFYDDLNVDADRVPDPEPVKLRHRRHRSVEEIDSLRAIPKTKTISVDTLMGRSKEAVHSSPASFPPAQPPAPPQCEEKEQSESFARREKRLIRKHKKESEPMNPITELKPPQASFPPLAPPPAPPEPQSPVVQEKPKREHENVRRCKERHSRKLNNDLQPTASNSTPPPPPPPPPLQERSSKSGSATIDFLNSLYHKKKKKPRQKSVDNLDSLLHQAQESISFQIPPPTATAVSSSPPTAFQNLFLTKKQKRKRTITVTLMPTPPPPPPRITAREPRPTSQTLPLPSHRTPNAIKLKTYSKFEETSTSGGESQLNRIPPPPPPPPPAFLKNPTWKFMVQGDYVRIDSSISSRSGSPDINDVDSDVTPSGDEGAVTPFHPSPLFCQSPDVNTKAESFITSFRAKLKLEKIHSMNGRQLGLSGLGPGPGPGPNQI